MMTSRERVMRAVNRQAPADAGAESRVPIDFGGHRSSGIMAIAYHKLKQHLGITSGDTYVYDFVQQLAIVEPEVLDRFNVDTIELGRGFALKPEDWRDWVLPDGTPCKIPAFIEPVKVGADWHIIDPDGTLIAIQKGGSLYFEQTCFPLEHFAGSDFSHLPEAMDKVMWAALGSPPAPIGFDAGGLQRLADGARALRQGTPSPRPSPGGGGSSAPEGGGGSAFPPPGGNTEGGGSSAFPPPGGNTKGGGSSAPGGGGSSAPEGGGGSAFPPPGGNTKGGGPGAERAVLGLFGGNLMEWGQFLFRMDNFLMLLAAEPRRMHRFLDALLEIHLDNLEKFLSAVGPYIDIILFGDDLGMQTGPQISVRMYREFFQPRHRQLWERAKQLADVKVMLHSCGSVAAYIPSFIEGGLDILQPVQTSAHGMEPAELKREFGRDLCLWGGGCDTQAVLPRGTPEQVAADVRGRIATLARGGGYVFQQVHNIMADVPPENIVAMLDAASSV